MTADELKKIGFIRENYGVNGDDNKYQCFHCEHGVVIEDDREKVRCNRWNIITNEDDKCDAFKLHLFWAFNQMDEDRERRRKKLENYKKNRSEGCYIATAVYGGYDMPEVLVLRKFRDEVLKKSFLGRIFIKVYYALSPSMAEKLKDYDKVNKKVKCLLDKFVKYLKSSSKLK